MPHLRTCLIVGVVAALAGCVGERASVSSARPAATTIGSVVVAPLNAILAVGGTVQLSVAVQSLAQTSLADFDSVTYPLATVSDSLRVRVSPQGLVTGLASSAATPVKVNAIVYKDGLARGDQSIVQVTPTAVSGVTLSVQPVAPDSAKLAQGALKTITPVIRNATTGLSVPTPVLRYTVKPVDATILAVYSPTIATAGTDGVPIQSGSRLVQSTVNRISPIAGEGSAWMYAEVTAYGTVLRDSVLYTFTYPATGTITLFGPTGVTFFRTSPGGPGENTYLGIGGTITFTKSWNSLTASQVPVTITFDNPAAAVAAVPPSTVGGASGDITATVGSALTQRRFLIPGTYQWTATAGGAFPPFSGQRVSGKIVVK